MNDRDKMKVPEPRSIDTDYRTLADEGRFDGRRSLFMVAFGDWRCSLGACAGPARCLYCSTGVWRYVDDGRCVDVAVYVAFQVLLVDLRFPRHWSETIHERFVAIRRPDDGAPIDAPLFDADDEEALLEAMEHRFRERHGEFLQSVDRLPNLPL